VRTYYKNDLKKAYLILEDEEGEKEDYQIIMLKENDIDGVLKTDVRYVDNQSHYYYDVSGKTSFKALHEKINLRCEDIKKLVQDLLQVIQTVQKYMLDGKSILLEPEYIFCDGDKYFFCYYPSCKQDVRKEFHRLTEFFVREVNYKDEEGVHLAYTLHKATMEDNYSIEEIMNRFLQEEKVEEKKEETFIVDYSEQLENTSIEESIIEEKDTMWEPVRRFLEKSKRRLWGYGSEDL